MYRKSPFFLPLLLSIAGLLVSSCNDNDNCIEGNGRISSITIDGISPFSGIIFSGAANINIVKGSEPRIVIAGENNIISLFNFNVSGSDLFIDSDRCYSAREEITITVTTPDLDKVETNGAGNVFSTDFFEADQLEIRLIGSGNISLLHNTATSTSVRLEGAGNIFLRGSGNTVEFRVIGSGNIEAFEYPSRDCSIIVDGSGNSSVSVEDNLNVEINGSGNVFYKGNPMINTTINGSGSVINAN